MILGLPPRNEWVPRNQRPIHKYIKALREAHKSGSPPTAPIVAPLFGLLDGQHPHVYSRRLGFVEEDECGVTPRFTCEDANALWWRTERVVDVYVSGERDFERERERGGFLEGDVREVLGCEGWGERVWGAGDEGMQRLGKRESGLTGQGRERNGTRASEARGSIEDYPLSPDRAMSDVDAIDERANTPRWASLDDNHQVRRDEEGNEIVNDMEQIVTDVRCWIAARIQSKISVEKKEKDTPASVKLNHLPGRRFSALPAIENLDIDCEDSDQDEHLQPRRCDRRTESLREQSVLRQLSVARSPVKSNIDNSMPRVICKAKSKRPRGRRSTQCLRTPAKDQQIVGDARVQTQISDKENIGRGATTPSISDRDPVLNAKPEPYTGGCGSSLCTLPAPPSHMVLPPTPPRSDISTIRRQPLQERSPPSGKKRMAFLEAPRCVKRRAVAVQIRVQSRSPARNSTARCLERDDPERIQPNLRTKSSDDDNNRLTPCTSNFNPDTTSKTPFNPQPHETATSIKVAHPKCTPSTVQKPEPTTHTSLKNQLRHSLKTLLRDQPPYAVVETHILPLVLRVATATPRDHAALQDTSRVLACWCSLIHRLGQTGGMCGDPFVVDDGDGKVDEEEWRPDTLSEDLTAFFGDLLDGRLPFGYWGFGDRLGAYNEGLMERFAVKERG
ncbi:hypothetical protein P153DRAFT_359995 [Dothidotthia symphoricarpi CBS 119687]|uniref:Uncharacterized protein n=1 Tax=Dothidotthia symphoricarpi CBS 119687 TaxID=1392245 RepID=A0A6A6A283_9PLEO|nr:uncharacterized protein P153DRAFT_359995 [Dothidotthia symphoricarpi CBS 119687]KAF2125646.1 hypothetical protein P153DRAFT_359995 [Dothidotthia symphoricarpi CBS 119687]